MKWLVTDATGISYYHIDTIFTDIKCRDVDMFVAKRPKCMHDLSLYDPWKWVTVESLLYIGYPTIFLKPWQSTNKRSKTGMT